MLYFCIHALLATDSSTAQARFQSEGTVFYFVHNGGPLEFRVRIFKAAKGFRNNPVLKVRESAVLTLADPAENMLEKHYWRLSKTEKEKSWSFRYSNASPGIWQLRSSFSPNSNLAIEFNTKPRLKYGVLFSRCRIFASDFRYLRKTWFLVPPPLANLKQGHPCKGKFISPKVEQKLLWSNSAAK